MTDEAMPDPVLDALHKRIHDMRAAASHCVRAHEMYVIAVGKRDAEGMAAAEERFCRALEELKALS